MKKIWKCKITALVLAGWFLLSLTGFLGRDTVYSRYQINLKKTPYFVLVVEGIHDGIYPWSGKTESIWETWEELAQRKDTDEELAGTESVYPIENVYETETAEESTPIETPKEFVTVEEDYFSDAVFIGDSRTVGLYQYGGLDDATFYATVGMNVYNLWTESFCEVNGEMTTLEEALTVQKFGKIYFQIGINEMGRGTVDGFMEAYSHAVEKFRELQPDAVIFVQGIMKVAKDKSESDAIFNNEGIEIRNERIAELADGIHVFYIDMNEAVCDEEGNLNQSLTFDDVHLYGSKYGAWVEFLLAHGIE